MPEIMLAEYQCLHCNRKWKDFPGPKECICGHLYVKWLNYSVWDVWYRAYLQAGNDDLAKKAYGLL